MEKIMKKIKANKKVLGIIVIVALIVVIALILVFKPKTLKCTRTETLLDGFTTNETLTVKIGMNKVKSIKLNKEINLSEYYDEYGTYYDSLEKVLNNAYSYLESDFTLTRNDYKIIVNIDSKNKGVILNNLSIKYNGDNDTTLRYDAVTDLSDSSTIQAKENITKAALKKKVSDMGYTCK